MTLFNSVRLSSLRFILAILLGSPAMTISAASTSFSTQALEVSTPQIEVPAELTFNLDTPGVTTDAQTLTIGNTGEGVLEISSISLLSDHFLVDVPADLTEIAAGASVDVTVTFRPTRNFNTIGSSLRIRSNSGGVVRSTTVRLIGNNPLRQTNDPADDTQDDGPPTPRLIVSGSGVFNLETPGVSSQTLILNVRNVGDGVFNFGTIQTTTPDFSVALPAGLTQLAPGASVDLPVTYEPIQPQPFHSGELTITSSVSNSAVVSVRLTGRNPLLQSNDDGTVVDDDDDDNGGVPEIDVAATVIFNLDAEGVTTQTQTITVSNVGSGTLEISDFRLFSGNFILNDAPEGITEIEAGASLDLSVTYRPLSSSSRHFGSINIFSDSEGSSGVNRVLLRGLNPLRQSNQRQVNSDQQFRNNTLNLKSSVITEQLSASVFPNPVNAVANLRIDAPEDVRSVAVVVTNLAGKTVRQLQVDTYGSTTIALDVADLTPGLYLLRLVDSNGEKAYTTKLLKQ